MDGIKMNHSIFIVIALILILLAPSFQATDLYADIEITVDDAGYVTIEGVSNYPNLLVENSESYTSKKQSLWTLNITKNETFSDYVYSVQLPKNSEISLISSSGSILIGEESGNLIIDGFGSNESLSIIIQYQTQKYLDTSELFGLDTLSIILSIVIVVLIISFCYILIFVDTRKKPAKLQKEDDSFIRLLKGLNERQKQILTLLRESSVALTQTDIQRELNMPKASVSRNIRRLELKGLIEKEQIGMSNLIRLKKP